MPNEKSSKTIKTEKNSKTEYGARLNSDVETKEADRELEKSNKDSGLSLGFSKNIFEKIVVGFIIVILAIFFGRVAIWEYFYYNEKEGSERANATVLKNESDEEEVDETVPTEEVINSYNVPADQPRYLSIDSLNIKNARVLSVGLKLSGELNTPKNIFDVGWYNASGKPGSGKTLLIDGHNGGPNVVGVFKYLDRLYSGDIITIERGDGKIFNYSVVENITLSLEDSDNYMSTAMNSPIPGRESLTLITCTGEWSQTRRTYLSRQFVRAVLIEDSDS